MRRFVFVVFCLLAGAAQALDFGTVTIEKGYQGPVSVDVVWADGTGRAVAGVTGTFIAYSSPPSGGTGGTQLFQKSLTPAGTPTNRLTFSVAGADTAKPGSYYVEVALSESGNVDTVHGLLVITGK